MSKHENLIVTNVSWSGKIIVLQNVMEHSGKKSTEAFFILFISYKTNKLFGISTPDLKLLPRETKNKTI